MSRFLKIIILIIFIVRCFSNTIALEPVIKKIIELSPSQISVFKSRVGAENFSEFDLLYKSMSQKIPTYIIDFNDSKVFNDSRKLKKVQKGFNSDLYILVEDAHNFSVDRVTNDLTMISNLNPSPPRVKFLITIYGNVNPFGKDLKYLLIQAWDLKFLDFSILIVNGVDKPMILNYNPFFETYDRYNALIGEFFPDKLNNMNGYSIRTMLHNEPSHIEFSDASNENSIGGVNYAFLKLTSLFLNFTFAYVEISKDIIPDAYVIEKVKEDVIDTSIMTHNLGSQIEKPIKNGDILFGIVVREAQMSLVGPVNYTIEDSQINSGIIIYSILTALIILAGIIYVKLCKLSSRFWTPLYVFGLLFGITLEKKPMKGLEKLLYIILAVISLKYSSDVFAAFSNDNILKKEEIVYDALKEVQRPSYTFYLQKVYFQDNMTEYDEIIQGIKLNSIPSNTSEECYEKLAKRKCFCFDSKIYATYMIKKYSDPIKAPNIKVIDPVILGDYFVHIFSKASPYVKKFDRKFQQILESGIQDSIYHGKKYLEFNKPSNYQNIKLKPVEDMNNQLIFFTVGCFLSILTLVFERVSIKIMAKYFN